MDRGLNGTEIGPKHIFIEHYIQYNSYFSVLDIQGFNVGLEWALNSIEEHDVLSVTLWELRCFPEWVPHSGLVPCLEITNFQVCYLHFYVSSSMVQELLLDIQGPKVDLTLKCHL